MAYLVVRKDARTDVRESLSTAKGPRSRTLATFRGALTPEVIERARARAVRPFDDAALEARAVELGIPVTTRREDRAARALLAHLRRGGVVDPVLVTLLRNELSRAPAAPVPDELADVAEWLGVDAARRAEALRGLLRVSDLVLRARKPVRQRPAATFPRFSSRKGRPR